MEFWYNFIKDYEKFKEACEKVAFYLKDINPYFENVDVWIIEEYSGTHVVEGLYIREGYSTIKVQFDIDLLGYSDYELAKYVQATLEGELEGTI